MHEISEHTLKEILNVLSRMNSYVSSSPKNKKSNLYIKCIKIKVYTFLTALLSLILMAIIVFIGWFFGLPKSPCISSILIILFFLNLISTLICVIAALIPKLREMLEFIFNFKREIFNDFFYEIIHDRKNIEKLELYSPAELGYVLDWVNIKIRRANSRIIYFFGGKTAILSIIGLSYSVIQNIGGLPKLGEIMLNGLFSSGITNALIVLVLCFLLGISLGALTLKMLVNYLQYIKEIMRIARKEKLK